MLALFAWGCNGNSETNGGKKDAGTDQSNGATTKDPEMAAADSLCENGNFDAAIVQYDRIIAANASAKEAYTGRAIARLQKGSEDAEGFAPALADLSEAMKLAADPQYDGRPDVAAFRGIDYYWRGQYYYALAQFDQAILDFTACIDMGYTDSDVYLHRALCKYANHDLQGGMQDLNATLKENPENHAALTNRGFYRSLAGDNRMAIADFDAALKLDPEDKETSTLR